MRATGLVRPKSFFNLFEGYPDSEGIQFADYFRIPVFPGFLGPGKGVVQCFVIHTEPVPQKMNTAELLKRLRRLTTDLHTGNPFRTAVGREIQEFLEPVQGIMIRDGNSPDTLFLCQGQNL